MIKYLKNIYQNQRCFIFGNGPSINNYDLSLLKNEYTFCSNWFINHKNIKELNINYYCAYDTAFVEPYLNQTWFEMLKNIKFEKMFFPKKWEKYNFSKRAVFLEYKDDIKLYEQNIYNVNIEEHLADGATVIINFCIPIAMYMGFKEIILIGVDNNYHQIQNKPYFYELSKHLTKADLSKERDEIWQEQTKNAYKIILEYANKHKISILNITQNSTFNIFKTVNFDDYFRKKS